MRFSVILSMEFIRPNPPNNKFGTITITKTTADLSFIERLGGFLFLGANLQHKI